jgi:ribokinase
MTGRIICLGDVMVDVLAVLPGPLAIGSDTPAAVTFRHGGAAANTAAWLAAIGARSVFLGRVGDDAFGRDVVDTLVRQGVEVLAGVDTEVQTGVCLVLVGPDGERTMVPSAGANDRLRESDLPMELFDPADHLHLSGYALLKDGARPTALAALDAALGAGAAVSVDAASAAPIRALGAQEFLGWLPVQTLLIANRDEAAVLSGCEDPWLAAAQLSRRFPRVVVKCGSSGALVAAAGRVQEVAGAAAVVIDSTGAGDAFAAGLLAALRRGADLREAAHEGNLLGARAVSTVGARPAGQDLP